MVEIEMRTRGMHGGRAEGMEEGGSRPEHEGGDEQRTGTPRARRRSLTGQSRPWAPVGSGLGLGLGLGLGSGRPYAPGEG